MSRVKIPIACRVTVKRFGMDPNVMRRLLGNAAPKRIRIDVGTKTISAMKVLGRLTALGEPAVLPTRSIAVPIRYPVVSLRIKDACEPRTGFPIKVGAGRGFDTEAVHISEQRYFADTERLGFHW